ncbi:MAG: sulfatase-like hydrolase/transferase, partial [bacterium]|nr:sulfatase-like hydrolase/transferase [bacterium]
EQMHSDFFVGNMAAWWLDTYPSTEPLFLQIGFPGPHPPYDPIARHAESYLGKELPILGLRDGDLEGQPPPFHELRKRKVEMDNDSIAHVLNPTPEQVKRQRAYYLANVTMIDEKVGEIMAALDRNGYLENAVVIFTSDNGDCLCDHGHSQKGVMYDAATHVPAVVWSPGRFEGGRRIDGLCQWIYLGPTVLEMAGLQPAQTMEAISLLPSLNGVDQKLRDTVFSEFPAQGGMMTMVRSRAWKLANFSNQPYGQLFDLEANPDETVNLWSDAACQEVKRDLRRVMCDWLLESNLKTGAWQAGWR